MNANFFPLILSFVLLFLNVPVGFSMLFSALLYFTVFSHAMPPMLILQQFISGVESFPLLAIPFFTTAGVIMNYSGISSRLMKFADLCVGHMNGGLAQVNVLLSTLMGGVSGSSNADAAMETKILVPEMVKRGYSTEFSAAVTVASSCITPVIPPGIMMILYCVVTGNSIGKMFMGGITCGVVLLVCMMVCVSIISKRRHYGKSRENKATFKEILVGFKDCFFALAMPFFILLGMRLGWFTPTEGGAFACIYCLLVGIFVYKGLKMRHYIPIIRESFYSLGQVMFIIVGANLMGIYLTYERIPQAIAAFLLGVTTNKYVFLIIVNLILIFIGMLVDGSPAVLIMGPLLAPIAVKMGINPIHFGLVVVVNLVIGGATPPFASMMFITCSLLKLPTRKFIKEIWPFIGALLIALIIIAYVEPLIMILPNIF